MPYELASLVVNVAADNSALKQVLAQTRSELQALSSGSGVPIKFDAQGAAASASAAAAAAKLSASMANIGIPPTLAAQVQSLGKASAGTSQSALGIPSAFDKAAEAVKKTTMAAVTATPAAQQVGLAVTKSSGGVLNLFKGLGSLGLANVIPPGLPDLTSGLEKSAGQTRGLLESLTSMQGVDLSKLTALAGLAGIGGGLVGMFEEFRKINSEATRLPILLKQAGSGIGQGMGAIDEFRNSLARSGQAAFSDITDAIEVAATKGPEKFRGEWQKTVQAAFSLSAVTGQTVEQSVRLLNLGQQNYANMQRMFRQIGITLRPHATMAEHQEALNRKIRDGQELMKARELGMGVQVTKVANALIMFKREMATALGPALVAPFQAISAAIMITTDAVKGFVNENKEQIKLWAKVVAGVMFAVASMLFFKASLFAVRAMAGQLGTLLLGPLVGAFRFMAAGAIAAGQAMWGGIVAPLTTIRILIPMISRAIQVALIGTVVGAVVVLAGALLQITGAMDWIISGVKSMVAAFQSGGKGWGQLAVIWKFLKTEFAVFKEALVRGFFSLMDAWKSMVNSVALFLTGMFGDPKTKMSELMNWMKDKFEALKGFSMSVWNEFLAELSIIGIRVQQMYLLYAALVQNAGNILSFIGEAAEALFVWMLETVGDNWRSILTLASSFMRIIGAFIADLVEALRVWILNNVKSILTNIGTWIRQFFEWLVGAIGSLLVWLMNNWRSVAMKMAATAMEWFTNFLVWGLNKAKEFWDAVSDPKKIKTATIDFSRTRAEIAETEEAANKIQLAWSELKWPEFKMGGSAMEDFRKLQKLADETKKKFNEERDRLRARMDEEKKKREEAAVTPTGTAPLGKPLAGGFSDLLGQWKKVQEAAIPGGQFNALEDAAKKQVEGQRQSNLTQAQMLEELRKMNGGDPANPLVPT